MIDAPQIIWEYLTASGTGLYTLVGARIYSPVAPQEWDNTTAMIVFEVDEQIHSKACMSVVDVDFFCYGGTENATDAAAVYRALFDRLQNAGGVVSSGKIESARHTGGDPYEREPTESRYPRGVSRFEIIVNSN